MTSRSHIIAPDRSYFCIGQCRKGDGSGSGTIFDAEFAQDACVQIVPVHALMITPISLSHMFLGGNNGGRHLESHRAERVRPSARPKPVD